MRIVIKGINPEPWAIGTINAWGKGKADMSANPKVVNYQKAIREDLEQQGYTGEYPFAGGWPLHVEFFYYRSTERGNQADTTNLNKATEDALQGVLFGNDRNNRRVVGEIMEQGPDVEHVGIVIDIWPHEFDPVLHEELAELIRLEPIRAFQDSDYEIPEDPFA